MFVGSEAIYKHLKRKIHKRLKQLDDEPKCAWIENCQHEVWGNCYWCGQLFCANHLITVAVYEKNQRRDQIEEDDVCLCCLARKYQELGQMLEKIKEKRRPDQNLQALQALFPLIHSWDRC
jgi:hypothetical protein